MLAVPSYSSLGLRGRPLRARSGETVLGETAAGYRVGGKVEDPDGLLDIEALEPEGPTTSIRVRVREDELTKQDDGVAHTLIVNTDDPDEPRLELEYRVTASR